MKIDLRTIPTFIISSADQATRRKHMADMLDHTGITYVFTFRSVQSWEYVLPDGRIAKPQASKKRKLMFQDSKRLFTEACYKQRRHELETRMAEFLHLGDFHLARKAKCDTEDTMMGVELLLKLKNPK